ncbi:MAG: polyhydroxyalkanoate synthesis regulator DNA-binding domain-containing protein [Chloroflexota bacterium]
MRLIKRYPNRKLYDTEDKRYVTLNDIAQLIRDGEEIQVQDHSTGEDLTALTLTQIIVEQEKRHAGFLPRSVLTGLVQAGGERLSTLRRVLAPPLGLQYDFDEEIDRRLQALVRDGELKDAEALGLREKLLQAGEREANGSFDSRRQQALERILGRYALPNRADIEALNRQVDELLRKIEPLLEVREDE